MLNRRGLIGASLVGSAMLGAKASAAQGAGETITRLEGPCVISTWDFGVAANQAAWAVLSKGGRALDAVEAGARIPEQDLKNHSVGRAGYPDRDGHVSLDACIMDELGNCGAVAALEHIAHPISVARKVMEKTPHVMLVGAGALQFALEQGFTYEELLTPESKIAWEAWKKDAKYQPKANSEVGDYGKTTGQLGTPGGAGNHDTIGMLAIDARGNISGACTTSGMAWKMRGRVGDSPIIGAGLYVDNDVGGATSTGKDVEIKTPDGVADAALFYPEGKGSWPAVVVWPDVMSLRPVFRDMGKRLAAAGYVVLVPNLYYRAKKAPVIEGTFNFANPDDRAKLTPLRATVTPEGTDRDAAAYVAFLDAQPQTNKAKKVGVQGYCMGGPLSFRTAAAAPGRVGAVATFHGGGLVTDQPTSPHLLIPKTHADYLIESPTTTTSRTRP
jgi:N4-(beta-N-acetylglucosaminyl)-L-asparaginase